MLSNIQSFLTSLAGDAETLFNRITTVNQLDRVTSVAALIAYADGTCDASEKTKTQKIIQVKLPSFTGQDIAKSWTKAESVLSLDFDFGKGDLLNVIAGAKDNDSETDLLIRVGVLIGGADGSFDEDEKKVVKEVCEVLGSDPSKYGL